MRQRPPAAPPLINYTSSYEEDQTLSTKGKIFSTYCSISKTLRRGSINPPPPPPFYHDGGYDLGCMSEGWEEHLEYLPLSISRPSSFFRSDSPKTTMSLHALGFTQLDLLPAKSETQWAAVNTHSWFSSEPPQKMPRDCKRPTCQGHLIMDVTLPPTMRLVTSNVELPCLVRKRKKRTD